MPADLGTAWLRAARRAAPPVAVVLGSGMGAVVSRVADAHGVAFADLPGMAASTVAGHAGRAVLGTWAGRAVLVFQGRLHLYEGWSAEQVTAPVRLAAEVGARVLIATNAAGGIRDDLVPGTFLVLSNHFFWRTPRDVMALPSTSPYAPRLVAMLLEAGRDHGAADRPGVYANVTGPCYETPAEIRAMRICGADAVGMSTAQEIEAGAALGLECAALSGITNRAAGLSDLRHDHAAVLRAAADQAERLATILERVIEQV
ncbi:MAG TPA: purine-nucleoside phosphorylase [Gemmataceae bacterium]